MKYICKICGQIIDTNDICPFCGSDSSKIEPYETEETKVYRCLNCGHELDQNEKCPFCGADSKMIFDISSNETTEDDIPETVVNEENTVEEPKFEYCEGDDCDCCCEDEDSECCCEDEDCECCCEDEESECCCHHDEEDHECCGCCHQNDDEEPHTRLTAESFEQEYSENECDGECEHCENCCSVNEESEADKEECCNHCHDEEEHCCCGHCHDENEYTFDEMVQDLLTVYGYLYKNDYAQAKIFEEYLRNFFREVALDFENELDVNEAFANLEDNVYFKDIIKQFN